MKRTIIIASGLLAVLLAGCSSFKLGSAMYCAYGEACSLQSMPVKPAPAAKAASGAAV